MRAHRIPLVLALVLPLLAADGVAAQTISRAAPEAVEISPGASETIYLRGDRLLTFNGAYLLESSGFRSQTVTAAFLRGGSDTERSLRITASSSASSRDGLDLVLTGDRIRPVVAPLQVTVVASLRTSLRTPTTFPSDDDTDDLDDMARSMERTFDASAVDDAVPDLISPDECHQRDPLTGTCRFSMSVRKAGQVSLNGPVVRLVRTDDVLTADIRITQVRIPIRVTGDIAGISFDQTGSIDYSSADYSADLVFGRSGATLSSASVRTTVSNPVSDFSGLSAEILSILNNLGSGYLRNLIRDGYRQESGRVLQEVANAALELAMETPTHLGHSPDQGG